MSDERRRDIAREHGLPEELDADQVATALEGAAAEIRRGGSHEGFLLDVIAAERAKHSNLMDLLTQEPEGS